MRRSSATPVLCLLKFLHKLRGPLKYEDDARDLCAKDEESLVEEDRRAGAEHADRLVAIEVHLQEVHAAHSSQASGVYSAARCVGGGVAVASLVGITPIGDVP
mmetsp:Transcript_69905/g.155805  ORF Transcript_69905/g.155805 Transcript_69905/m.155805 type:complete len:103 (+) Transcript_69905:124-432(+)